MKDPKPTKKELAAQTKDLEEEVTRLKNRLNGQVFKKTKHGYRLDQLSEGAQQLNGRIEELEHQLAKLNRMQEELTEKWQELGRDTETLKNKNQEAGGKKRLKEQLGKLKSSVTELSLLQQQTGATLKELQNTVSGVGNVRDDLKLETDELRSQVRNLEESSSRLSVNQSSQEARTRELEGLLAELTLRQQNLAAQSEAGTNNIKQQLEEKIAPIRSQLQLLGEHTSEENGRHKEVERRLQELANRIGDLGGRFNHLSQDVADQHRHREYLQQELDPRLQQLEARTSGIDTLEAQLSAYLKGETGALWNKLEEAGKELIILRERLDTLDNRDQLPGLDQKLSGVEAEVSRLTEAGDLLQESFQGLGGLELNLTSRLDNLQRQLQEHIVRSRESEEAIHRLSGELVDMGSNLQQQFDQSDLQQQHRIEALEQKLGSASTDNPDNHRQEVDAQLDRIEEAFTAERERIFQLEESVARTRDQNEAQRIELEQGRLLQQELQSRLEDLNEDFANQTELSTTLTAGVEVQTGQQRALADRVDEQAGQQQELQSQIEHLSEVIANQTELNSTLAEEQAGQQKVLAERVEEQATLQRALSDRVDRHVEQQSALHKEGEAIREVVAALEQREQQSAGQAAELKQEQRALRLQLEAEKPKIEEHSQTLQALTNRFDKFETSEEAQQLRIDKCESTGKTHRIALFSLLLFGILGGLALFFSNAGEIAESEQQIAQKLISPDPRYITREDLSEKLYALETGQAGNSEKILEVEKALPPQSLWERQIEMEQQLARFEVKLNLLTAGAQEGVAKSANPTQPVATELERIHLDIERINTALTQLSAQPATDNRETDLPLVEQRLVKTLDQLGERIDRLEAYRTAPEAGRIAGIEQAANEAGERLEAHIDQLKNQQNSIAKIERDLIDTRKVFGDRLNELAAEGANTREKFTQLQHQVQALATPRNTFTTKSASPDKRGSEAIWQAAADARRYAIQLAGSRSKSSLIAFMSGQPLQSNAAYFRTVHEGREWYILLYGPYTGFKDALKALEGLPASLNRYTPWIRRIPKDAEFIE